MEAAAARAPDGVLVRDSVTELDAAAQGRVALCASHGGTYAAWHAARRGVAALLLHDAGLGRDGAGVAGLGWLAARGVPAAAIGHLSARIGDGADMAARGTLSTVNAPAAALGLVPGMAAARALAVLAACRLPPCEVADTMDEAERELPAAGRGRVRVFLLDSNGLVAPRHAGHVVVTGSHGGLLGGRPETAVKHPVRAALYNDAGIGADGAGLSRLGALAARGIAAACVAATSARIGEAASTYADGVVSAVNAPAAARGGRVGQAARDFVACMAGEAA